MKSFDYEACVYDGAVYCNGCLPEGITTESEDVSPIFADSEHDGYPVCDKCGEVHNYVSLTDYGYKVECSRQNIEVFHMGADDFSSSVESGTWMADAMENNNVDWCDPDSVKIEAEALAGYYYWQCFHGCLPEGDAIGPFKTALDAAKDAINQ